MENLGKIAENDVIAELLVKDHDLFCKLLKMLFHFKKEKYFGIKTFIYNIFSNIFTLDNKYLEVF